MLQSDQVDSISQSGSFAIDVQPLNQNVEDHFVVNSGSGESDLLNSHEASWLERRYSLRNILSFSLKILVLLLLASSVEYVFHNPYCNLLFRCGCTWNWSGGWEKCNFHNLTGPKCPWCSAPWPLYHFTDWLPQISIVAIFLVLQQRFPQKKYLLVVITGAIASWFVVGFIVAIVFKLFHPTYPYFLIEV
jgi:hypothetical protein